ncbi:MAG: prepilin-type N-terminal cleavage/methylation domain-containing protein [Thermodesulfobacteriota bacterium]|nr:prepilin-type N-terminal cleavage/methylation domain-containing protein [Thermodesulfobacteriota bacterium]
MDKGFTLIEVLIAMVILSITFVWLLKAENQGIEMAQRSRFITTATLLAQEHISGITSGDATVAPGQDTGEFGEGFTGYTYIEQIESTPMAGYMKYTLEIFWGGEESGFETRFITYISSL